MSPDLRYHHHQHHHHHHRRGYCGSLGNPGSKVQNRHADKVHGSGTGKRFRDSEIRGREIRNEIKPSPREKKETPKQKASTLQTDLVCRLEWSSLRRIYSVRMCLFLSLLIPCMSDCHSFAVNLNQVSSRQCCLQTSADCSRISPCSTRHK